MDLKQWHCKNNHALGVIRLNGDQVPQLMLYRHAVDLSAETPAEVDMMIGPLVGRMPVRCDICDDVRLWDVSVQALADLILGMRAEQMEQLTARVERERERQSQRRRSRQVME